MNKDLNTWNTQKQKIHSLNGTRDFYEREVWWTRIGVNVGVEIDGRHELFMRPVVIVRKFNRNMALVIPTTSKNKSNKYYLDVAGEDGKVYKTCLSQIRVISVKRLLRKIGTVRQENHTNLINKVAQMMYGSL